MKGKISASMKNLLEGDAILQMKFQGPAEVCLIL